MHCSYFVFEGYSTGKGNYLSLSLECDWKKMIYARNISIHLSLQNNIFFKNPAAYDHFKLKLLLKKSIIYLETILSGSFVTIFIRIFYHYFYH